MTGYISHDKKKQILEKLEFLFRENEVAGIYNVIEKMVRDFNLRKKVKSDKKNWLDEKDVFLITYGDSIIEDNKPTLKTLHEFLKSNLLDHLAFVHILPFYPYSSDDGFSVIDYFKVNPELGDWSEVEDMSKDFKLMFDAVINHISAKSEWFQEYLKGNPEYLNYFIETENSPELSKVFRPRALPLLTKFDTSRGEKLVWTTFSTDQIDLNFQDGKLFLKIVELLLFYAEKGAKSIRLDAIGFMWKIIGTSCMHLPQTHKAIQLFRDIFDVTAPETLIITETNVPHKENISYFGDGKNEAQLVYQFPLPPLVLYSLISGDSSYLSKWAGSLELVSDKTTFFNFLSSHDGIGVIPTTGILGDKERQIMAKHVKKNGGFVSNKTIADGSEIPYELNINYFDAIADFDASDDVNVDRFIASQSILLCIVGVPAIYIHSILGSRNWYDGVIQTSRYRTINRERLERSSLEKEIEDNSSIRYKVLNRYKKLIEIRKKQPAFHPNAPQQVIYPDNRVFALIRSSLDCSGKIIVLSNISSDMIELSINLDDFSINKVTLIDLISGNTVSDSSGLLKIKLNPYQVMWLK